MAETQIQQACVKLFRLSYPHLTSLFFKIHNEGKKSKRAGAQDKLSGVVSGIPDTFLSIPNSQHNGLYVEFKQLKGTTSKTQLQLHKELRNQGYQVEIVRDTLTFQSIIKNYLNEK
jgi:hypothetical protein